jgi:signal transduction histidine kinase
VREASRYQSLSRIASVVRLMETLPEELATIVARHAGGPMLQFTLAPESAVKADDDGFRAGVIKRAMQRRLGDREREIQVAALGERDDFWRWSPWNPMSAWRRLQHHHRYEPDDDEDDRKYWRRRDAGSRALANSEGMLVAIRLQGGGWLNAKTLLPPVAPSWAAASLSAMAVTAVALVLLVVLLVRRVTRPLGRLSVAAERAGRGAAFQPVEETGPSDVRETIAAFNRMQERQQRYIADRTRMLAAISHDLRTPITSLRIRAEFIEDAELQAKILATLDEMQAMTEATLGFAREDATEETFQETDLSALCESVAADAADIEKDASYIAPEGARVVVSCRPIALRRALRNIVDNALAYGGTARVAVERANDAVVIVVDDDGPGIPDSDQARVFEPFVRLEESRNRETGGIGLGMAIARTILRAHGGDVELENRQEGGLRVRLTLPTD